MDIPPLSSRYSPAEVQSYYDAGCWTTETFTQLLARRAGEHEDKVFITDGTAALTYGQVRDDSIRLATGLRERGRSGDRVAVQFPNWAEFVVVAAAVARLGAIMVPIMPIYRRDEVAHVLDDAQMCAVVTPATFKRFDYLAMYRELAATRPTVHTVVVARDAAAAGRAGPPVVGLDAVTANVDPAQADSALSSPATADDPYVIVYTSGTTARPKGCVHTFNTYVSGARALGTALAYREDDVQFGP